MDINGLIKEIESAQSLKITEDLHQKLFSKSGYFAERMKQLANLSVEEKKSFGKTINEQKNILLEALQKKQEDLKLQAINEKIAKEKIDLSLPINGVKSGGVHPISYTIDQMIAIFAELGFKVALGQEMEEDWYNFTALNVPAHHPARQDHDTFYLNMLDEKGQKKLLRTHTSNVQIRTMMDHAKQDKDFPISIIAPGKTYRSDSDATHSPMFHQIEGLFVDKRENVSVPQLKAVLMQFLSKFFEVEDLPLRLRPSYFPFTSPSYEVDIVCDRSKDQLIIGSGNDWLEVLGCGIVHPNVLKNCGIDPEIYGGFAFGMGIERLTMLKYGFKDLRTLFEGDIRWLAYNNISALKTPSLFGGLN
jgi:phenylalanyl-tRNA synthetase alpha chain